MFSNRFMHDRRVASTLMPLYTRVMKESVKLTDYQQTVESANSSEDSNTEVAQFANLYLRKILAELESPRTFFRLQGNRKLDVKPRRKSAAYTARYIAENLHVLYERININDLHAYHADSSRSRLFNSVNYYRMALLIAANTLEGGDSKTKRFSSAKSIRQRLHSLRKKSDRLVAIPPLVVDQFKEKSYLLANMDVRAALADGGITCGMEHFVMQGVQEAKKGGRPTPGIDLDLIQDERIARSEDQLQEIMQALTESGMFDSAWYQKQYGKKKNAVLDYCQKGYLEGRAPNALFNQEWYCANYSEVNSDDVIPAFHYVSQGEAAGLQACESFNGAWYKQNYKLPEATLGLAHYLKEGKLRGLNPNAILDVRYYLEQNPDVTKAGMDPVDHYYRFGWKERREPNVKFKTLNYIKDKMNGAGDINPVTFALMHKNASPEINTVELDESTESVTDSDLPSLGDIAGNIKYFANPGPDFESPSTLDCAALKAKAKAIAFYLPQFHAFEENDRWWGKGFTEWRNVTRGTPRYAGHYQPRIPRDLGFYDLNDPNVMREQSAMALRNGIEAFCFYYYWFNGKRLMDKPLDMFADLDVDQEFCIMWANENWTRTWDGFDSEVLIEQDYNNEDEDDFIDDTARYFLNDRYMKVNGRPLFIMYRPGLMPDARATFDRWRAKWEEKVGVAPWILMVQGFDNEDPREFGLDGAVEFPPHKICKDIPNMQDQLNILDPAYEGYAKSYTDVIKRSLGEKPPEFPLIKTVVPHWDNDARREGRGFTMHGSTPALYESWLQGAINYADENPFQDEPLVFINAWNEWAEGAYLEPDVHYGHAYLNATKRAVHGLVNFKEKQRILLVGHDAYKHGAQMLLLSMAKIYKCQFGMDVTVLLKKAGPLLAEYQELGQTVVLEQLGEENLEGWLRHESIDIAVCNTSVTGDLVPTLKRAGVAIVSLIHELPNLINEYNLGGNLQMIAEGADHVVFPSQIVKDGFAQFASEGDAKRVIRPQGTYKPIEFEESKRLSIRHELGIQPEDKMVLNVGYADLRKGFDSFLQMAKQMVLERPDVHFVWAGAIAPDMERWVQSDLDEAIAKRIHLVGFTSKMADFYSASDVLFLSSREDPYPTVVLEAMNVGLPVVLYKSATGFDQLISQYGHVVDRNDISQVKRALVQSLYNDSRADKDARVEYVEQHCQFDDYCFDLLQMLRPDIEKISVVVPNYNYEQYMPSRLTSVFNQTYPVFETIVLDDQSKDNSVEAITALAETAGRIVNLQVNTKNSGNVFKQWHKGMKLCRGNKVWIAEADDLASPAFLSRSVAAFNSSTCLSFTDSAQIGPKDEKLADSYDYYFRTVDAELFNNDFRLEGKDFIERAISVRNVILNVSSVLWDTKALTNALDSVGERLYEHKLVGDWLLYLTALAVKGSNIAYVSDSLNTHRRHENSVTHALDNQRHLNEIQAMHEMVNEIIDADFELANAMQDYVVELRKQFKLDKPKELKAAA